MNFQEIYTDSDPSGIVKADVGTMFIREGTACFVRTPYGAIEKLQQTYRPKEYARKEYSSAKVIYNTPYEVWQKVANSGKNTGWKLVGNVKYFGNVGNKVDGLAPTASEDSPSDGLNPWVAVNIELYKSVSGENVSVPELSYDSFMYDLSESISVVAYIDHVQDIPDTASFNTASIYCVSASNIPQPDASFLSIFASIGAQFFNANGTTSSLDWVDSIKVDSSKVLHVEILNPYSYNKFYSEELPLFGELVYTVTESIGSCSIVVNNSRYNGLEKTGSLLEERPEGFGWAYGWAFGGAYGWARGWADAFELKELFATPSADRFPSGGTLRLHYAPCVDAGYPGENFTWIGGAVYSFPPQFRDIIISPSNYTGSLMLEMPTWTWGHWSDSINVWLQIGENERVVVETIEIMSGSAEVDISRIFRKIPLNAMTGSVLLSFTSHHEIDHTYEFAELAYDVNVVTTSGSASLDPITGISHSIDVDSWVQGWEDGSGHLVGIRFDDYRSFSGRISLTETAT